MAHYSGHKGCELQDCILAGKESEAVISLWQGRLERVLTQLRVPSIIGGGNGSKHLSAK